MGNPLFDKDFLKELDRYPIKEKHVRITSLDYNDVPVEQIEGICTGGNINIDGASSLRRSCKLTIQAPIGTKITNYHWAFNHKFKVEIGLTNYINSNYEDIIWFPQGIYIVNSFSNNETTNGVSVSIGGQDKMCRLNGTISGKLPIEVDFAHIDEVQPDGSIVTSNILLHDVLEAAVHEYGQERKSNIIINDLDMQGLELWEYRGNLPLYLFYSTTNISDTNGSVLGIAFGTNSDITMTVQEYDEEAGTWGQWEKKQLSAINQYFQLNTLDADINKTASRVKFTRSGYGTQLGYIIKLGYGDAAGYHQTPLTYPGDLIVAAGTAVEQGVITKIKEMLGEYEYFYDLNGRFVFQKKKTYIQELFSPINGDIVEPMMLMSPYSYEFDDLSMITSISYNPQIAAVKNDFVIWGTKESGAPIHVRYAIQKKPTYYKTTGSYDIERDIWSDGELYYTSTCPYDISEGKLVDWRELIYQMARDYNLYNQYIDFYTRVDTQNIVDSNLHLYPDGKTKMEQYYTDMYSFWRYLYDPDPENNPYRYYPYQEYYSPDSEIKPGWNKLIHTNPEGLVFWFDFLDVGDGPLHEFSVDAVGSRVHVEKVTGSASICKIQTPEILFAVGTEEVEEDKNTTAYAISNIGADKKELFNISSTAVSLISKANDLIYQYACCAETISLTCLSIYYLEPNTRIKVKGIGDLIVNSFGHDLGNTGTMTLSCTKVIQSIY